VSDAEADGRDRDAALAGFEQSRTAFEEAVRRAPDAALRYRPPDEDYALGGLVVHVTQVLRRYTDVLNAIHAADWQSPTAPPDQTTEADAALIREGFGGDRRSAILGEMREVHGAFVQTVLAEPADWFSRQAPVLYPGSSEPYPTSPADVVGWVRDHYAEHATQIADLVSAWAIATR
jgi:hypothetical protein